MRADAADESKADRLSFRVKGPTAVLDKLVGTVKKEAGFKRGLKGVVYGLGAGGVEILLEGNKQRLESFVGWGEKWVTDTCEAMEETCPVVTTDITWKQAEGIQIYTPQFKVVDFEKQMRVKLWLRADQLVLSYFLKHMKLQSRMRGLPNPAVTWVSEEQLQISQTAEGNMGRLKSFVRWCKKGPPMVSVEDIRVTWEEVAVFGEEEPAHAPDEGLLS